MDATGSSPFHNQELSHNGAADMTSAYHFKPRPSEDHDTATLQDSISINTFQQPSPRRSIYRKFMGWCQRYRRYLIASHFAFIFINCAVILPIAILVNKSEAAQSGVSAAIIDFTIVVSLISSVQWLYSTIISFFGKLEEFHVVVIEATIRMKRRSRFWTWLVYNVLQFSIWLVITVLYWDVSFACLAQGDWADFNPFKGTCDELSNIWFYGSFTAAAIGLNLIFIVEDEIKESLRELIEKHELELEILKGVSPVGSEVRK